MAATTFARVDLLAAANRSWVGDWAVSSFPQGAQTHNGTPFVIPGDASGARYASVYIKFVGSDGSFEQFNLLGGSDARDFNNFVYTNTINDNDAPSITTTNALTLDNGQNRLDEQTFQLDPLYLTDNIVKVVVTDNGADGFSRAALSGLTFGLASIGGTVPEPTSWALMLALFVASVRLR